MNTIIPAINCHVGDDDCVREHLAIIRDLSPQPSCIHIDICDGIFTPHKTWNSPLAWKDFQYTGGLEVHLMTEHPERIAELWLQAGAQRIIVHVETLIDVSGSVRHLEDGDVIDYLLQLCQAYEATCMISSIPETPLVSIEPLLRRFQEFQVLSVTPGFSGQHFLPLTLEKVSFLRSIKPHAWIEVDGGMNTETAVSALSSGVSALVSSSFIFSHSNPAVAYRMLCDIDPSAFSSTSGAVVKKSPAVQSKKRDGRSRSRSH
ncbi:MAG: hypothetical protein RIQ54_247 [Candidatus Parcubacteria bacterium]|jgi:ribulose-phosphate 3-epimerase